MYNRTIKFPGDTKYAVVLAAYYGGRGYTTHSTEESAIRAARRQRDYSLSIIDSDGNYYDTSDYGYYNNELRRI